MSRNITLLLLTLSFTHPAGDKGPFCSPNEEFLSILRV